jgi:hypothetical protein
MCRIDYFSTSVIVQQQRNNNNQRKKNESRDIVNDDLVGEFEKLRINRLEQKLIRLEERDRAKENMNQEWIIVKYNTIDVMKWVILHINAKNLVRKIKEIIIREIIIEELI